MPNRPPYRIAEFNTEKIPYRDPHTAVPCLWAISHEIGPALKISYVSAADNQAKILSDRLNWAALTVFLKPVT